MTRVFKNSNQLGPWKCEAYMIGEKKDRKGCASKTKTSNKDNSSISTPRIMDQIKGLTVQ